MLYVEGQAIRCGTTTNVTVSSSSINEASAFGHIYTFAGQWTPVNISSPSFSIDVTFTDDQTPNLTSTQYSLSFVWSSGSGPVPRVLVNPAPFFLQPTPLGCLAPYLPYPAPQNRCPAVSNLSSIRMHWQYVDSARQHYNQQSHDSWRATRRRRQSQRLIPHLHWHQWFFGGKWMPLHQCISPSDTELRRHRLDQEWRRKSRGPVRLVQCLL